MPTGYLKVPKRFSGSLLIHTNGTSSKEHTP